MAKEQGLSLNPVKISGACGRLMCCLKYEQEAYQDLLKNTPKVGALVSTPDGKGVERCPDIREFWEEGQELTSEEPSRFLCPG